MYADLDRIAHNYEIHAARLPLNAVKTAIGGELMSYAIKAEVVKTLAAMSRSSADESRTPVYVLLKSDIASEGMEIRCFFVSEKEILVLPDQYATVFFLLF